LGNLFPAKGRQRGNKGDFQDSRDDGSFHKKLL
jgi:hypothetical protein